MGNFLACVIASAALIGSANAQVGGPRHGPPPLELTLPALAPNMTDAEISAALDGFFASYAERGAFSGVALAARNGREIYVGAYGEADRAAHAPNTADTRFDLASIGKAFTHVAVLQLIQQGRLALETTIGDVIPDYPNAPARNATIGQLLTHRGGIADIFGPAFRDAPKDQFVSNAAYYAFVSQQPQLFAPGEREEYCNGCYIVLGEIIARVSGTTYEDYVRQHILAPAGMTRTDFLRRDRMPADGARPYGSPRPDMPLMDVTSFHGAAGNGAGGVFASARDLLAFDNAVREHRLLNAEQTARFLGGQPQEGRATTRQGRAGGGPGTNAILVGNGDWTLILLTNRDPPFAESAGPQLFPLLAGQRPS